VEKYCTAGQATDDNIIQRMSIACCIIKATDTHSEYVILAAFHSNNSCTKAPQYYVTRTLHVLLLISCAGNENDERNYVAVRMQ
jgi:hypothetical protein